MESWKPGVDAGVLKARGDLLHAIREFFYRRGVIEVTTPTLGSRGVTDNQIQNLKLDHQDQTFYLQTSPEYAMKRLLASGSGSIYQICPAYRGSEQGQNHNTEFSMLEWYRLGFTLLELMDDVQNLLSFVTEAIGISRFDFRELSRFSYRDLFVENFDRDPHMISLDELKILSRKVGVECGHITDHDDEGTVSDYLDLLFSVVIEPQLDNPTIVYDYPVCQVALAQLGQQDGNSNGKTVAKRFEVFVSGLELANGYLELLDADELEARMHRNNHLRGVRGQEIIEPDEKLLAALPAMPASSGIALGVDRLLMVLLGKEKLVDVVSFTGDRI
jgi:lysyl-tRNA synthetase class 2